MIFKKDLVRFFGPGMCHYEKKKCKENVYGDLSFTLIYIHVYTFLY